jgi:hypothetical protein
LFGATGATGLNVRVQRGVKGLVEMSEQDVAASEWRAMGETGGE